MQATRPVLGAKPPRAWTDELLSDCTFAGALEGRVRAGIANALACQCVPWFLEFEQVRNLVHDFNARFSAFVLKKLKELESIVSDRAELLALRGRLAAAEERIAALEQRLESERVGVAQSPRRSVSLDRAQVEHLIEKARGTAARKRSPNPRVCVPPWTPTGERSSVAAEAPNEMMLTRVPAVETVGPIGEEDCQ